MDTAAPAIEQIKASMRATWMRVTWMAADFGMVARIIAGAAEEFIARLPIAPGARVLDRVAGTGNLAIPPARAGAAVTGVDIATNLLEQARERAAAEGLSVHATRATPSSFHIPTAPSTPWSPCSGRCLHRGLRRWPPNWRGC
jgi:2-polyprenyl-3-methyl-5-hydroxy-6-metoxy-1,4-benzoquinol methylase